MRYSALMFFWLMAVSCLASSVTLAWDPSPGSDIAGYNIYYGPHTQVYTNTTPVGNVTNATIGGLLLGATYFFAATAVNTSGLESDFSNEVSYTVPSSEDYPLPVIVLYWKEES